MWIFGFALMQIIVFGVVLYFYKKITAGDTENTVNRLGAVYEDLLKKQKNLTEKLEAAEKEYQAKKEEEILKKARVEAEDILSKAHASRDQLAKEMEIAASKKVVDFAAELLRNIYDDKMKALIHGQFIKNFMDQAKKSDLASVDLRDQRPILRTAIALTKEDQEPLRKVLAERLGSPDLQLEETVDEKLIAGVALQIGTLSLDGSFANAVRESANLVKEKIQD